MLLTSDPSKQPNIILDKISDWCNGIVCLGSRNIFICIFNFYVASGVQLKGMIESFLLSKDEPLTPNIDEVMAVWIFRRRAQNTKIGKKWTSQFCFLIFLPPSPWGKSLRIILLRSLQAGGHKKNPGTKPITTSSWINFPPFGTAHFPAKSGCVHFGPRNWLCIFIWR